METPFYDLLIRNGRLLGESQLMNIGIVGGQISTIAPHLPHQATETIDVQGKFVSAPFVESHVHLDSAHTAGEPRWNESGTLFEGIQIWGDRKQNLTREDVKDRALKTLRQQASQGVLWVRSHVDISEPGLNALKALLEVREAVKSWMTLQIVAFPQDGIYSRPENERLLEQALEMGADVVGGIPHYELTREDGVKSVERVFELAQKYDCLIDFHCDEIDDDQSRFLEVVSACAIRTGLGEKVTASHTTAFGSYNNAYAYKLMGFLDRSQINFIANPLINITLQGRTDTYPKRRGVTRVKELWQRGLNVSLGHDCIQDPWYSLGTGNMLEVANMAVHICQMTGRSEINACYDMVTKNGAKTLNCSASYGVEVGKPANLIVLDAESPYETICKRATVVYVVAQGKLLATTTAPQVRWLG
ncbi:cytosine deaminase [Spirulina subsalsa FACHB-351]|uniref:Cytosine deaminase n=1 Tax=Spirulina subsalsa FACHB-351 TaxID=234711 RepID=A0ABT3L2Z4_9CYAN|nr:cytosine deaminase [Spirulina subsalsa]MCW6035822.1 cytosine deaminase [Spirulina subsalsa FACHB-351]